MPDPAADRAGDVAAVDMAAVDMAPEQRPRLLPGELDELYTRLCYGLTELGQDRTPMALARLALLLMDEVGDPERVRTAIDEALQPV